MAQPIATDRGRGRSRIAGLDLRGISKPDQARMVLLATAFVGSAALLAWLLLFLGPPGGGVRAIRVTPDWVAAPVLPFQDADLRLADLRSTDAASAPTSDRLASDLRRIREGQGRAPAVIYLSAAGAADADGVYLLASDHRPASHPADSQPAPLPASRLLDLLGDSPRDILLILDASQVGTDRNLGIFGNGFVQLLADLYRKRAPSRLAILLSCVPGQFSWTSEAERRSVFGHFVARGLAGEASPGRGLTVRSLADYVRRNVSAWVDENHHARQTPMLLLDGEDFGLPLSPKGDAPASAADPKKSEENWARLQNGWKRRDELDAAKGATPAFRRSPVRWRLYLESLRRAERLLRAGRESGAADALDLTEEMEREMQRRPARLPLLEPWSLALAEAHAPNETRQAVADYREQIEKALVELTEVRAPDEAAAEPGPPRVEAAPPARPVGAPPAQAGAPAPKPVGASGLGRDEKRPGETPKSGRPGPAQLGAWPDQGRPSYLEAQVLTWAQAFRNEGASRHFGSPDFFAGDRGLALREAARVRQVAEEAAASDERARPWAEPAASEGDKLRRRAQDRLFAAGGDAGADRPAGGDDDWPKAVERYRRSLDDARSCVLAFDLVERLHVELPYLAEWAGRRARLVDDVERLILDTSALADLIEAGPRPARDGGGPAGAGPVGLEERRKSVQSGYQELSGAFLQQCRTLADAQGEGSWRQVDDALVVPTIPADLRRRLVRKAQAPPATPLDSSRPAPEPDSAATPSKSAGGRKADEEFGEEDPTFWPQALASVRLEKALLRLAGAREDDLASIAANLQAASKAIDDPRGAKALAFAKLSTQVLGVRSKLIRLVEDDDRPVIRSIGPPDEAIRAKLGAADRAARALPLADVVRWPDDVDAENLDRFRRYALLLQHGRRLLDDFAPKHARLLFQDAEQLVATADVRKALGDADRVALAQLRVVVDPPGDLVLKDWSESRLTASLETLGEIPLGEAAVFVGSNLSAPLSLTLGDSARAARGGILLAADPARPPRVSPLRAVRTDATKTALAVPLSPFVFYRGRPFPAPKPLLAELSPTIGEDVDVSIHQSYARGFDKRYPDQFKFHPGQGYIHSYNNLAYVLKLTNKTTKPLRVTVLHKLKGGIENLPVEKELLPNKPVDVVDDVVKHTDVPLGPPRELEVTVQLAGRKPAQTLARRVYLFHQLLPKDYVSASAVYVPEEGRLRIYVTHLASDGAVGPIKVQTDVAGLPGDGKLEGHFDRGATDYFWFPIPQPPPLKITWSLNVEANVNAIQGVTPTEPLAPGKPPAQPAAPPGDAPK